MNKKSGWLRRLAPVTCLLALAGSAHAASVDTGISGSAQIGNFVFTLVDLDPNDGIVPAYWFDQAADGPAGYTDGFARTGRPGAAGNIEQLEQHSKTTYLSDIHLASSGAGIFSDTTVTASGISLSGGSSTLGSGFLSTARAVTQPLPTGYPYTLWITPNTQLTVSATASTSASVGNICQWKWSTLCGSVHADVSMLGGVADDPGHSDHFSALSSDAGLGHFWYINTLPEFTVPYFDDGGLGLANSSSGTLSITFTNASTRNASQYLQIDLNVFAQAVPEPSTHVLMLAGLVALAAFARRQP